MTSGRAKRCIAVIPAFNEAATIRDLALATSRFVDEVVVVDDGSTDGTSAKLDGTGVRVLRHEHNRGKGACLALGLDLAADEHVDEVVTLDADLQHDPADIPRFRDAARANPDALVLGDRSADMGAMPPSRAFWIRFGNVFIGWACQQRIGDAQCGMRLYPTHLWLAIRDRLAARDRAHFVFETAALLHAAEAGARFVYVPIAARYGGPVVRRSHYRPVTDGLRIARTVARFLVTRGFRPRRTLIALRVMR